jgi:uncharacterized repeat protein (TIGR01451 family)
MLKATRLISALSLILFTTFTFAAQSPRSSAPVTFPLSFEANHGQTAPQVRYLARSREGTLFFTDAGVTVAVPTLGSFRMLFDGTNASPQISAQQLMSARSNYLDPDHGRSIPGVENFAALQYSQLYPGIDLRFYGNDRHLEHEFQLAPGADVSRISLRLEGTDALSIASDGEAQLTLGHTVLRESAPIAWQTINNHRIPVAAKWALLSRDHLGITLGSYDRTQPVTIDPVLAYSTHLGGHTAEDLSLGTTFPADTTILQIVLDTAKNIYVSGTTGATDYPTTAGAFDRTFNTFATFHDDTLSQSGFISKFDPTGHRLIYSTFLRNVVPLLAVDSAGHAYAAKGEDDNFGGPTDGSDVGIAVDKLSVDGSQVLFTTRFGATAATATCFAPGNSDASGLAVDNVGHVWVAGRTDNPCWPVSATALEKTNPNANEAGFVFKLDTTKAPASSMVYSTLFGVAANADIWQLTVDSSGNAYVAGDAAPTLTHGHAFGTPTADRDGRAGFVAKINATGSALVFSTLIHGQNPGFFSRPAVALDSSRNVYVAGITSSTAFPTTAGAFQTTVKGNATCTQFEQNTPCPDAFVMKINSAGSAQIFSTLIGGTQLETQPSLRVNSAGMAFIAGSTQSPDFPTTANAFKRTYPTGAGQQAFVTAFNADGKSLYYSTLLGGSKSTGADSLFVDPAWNAWVVGNTQDTDFPVTSDSFMPALNGNSDGFISKIVIASDLSLTATATAAAVSRNTIDTFLETVTNKGPDFAQSVVLSNPIPAGFSFQGITFSTFSSCTFPAIGATSGTISCTKVQLNSGANAQLHFKLKAIAASGSNLVDKASTTSHMQDLNKANNTASVTVHVK